MRILITGSDGYIGYPLCQKLLERGHVLYGIDCLFRRSMVRERGLESIIPIKDWSVRAIELKKIGVFDSCFLDIARDYEQLMQVFQDFKPEGIVNLGQQPSAPYSMIDQKHAEFTLRNNIIGALNMFLCMKNFAPKSSIVTLGTMGEYGQPNLNIPEGFFKVEYDGKYDILPFPKQTNSVYHTSKAQISTLAWFAARVWMLRCTDIMQGVVYGTKTDTITNPNLYTRFDVGECFGTMINRAVACAIIGHPIIVYGSGYQTRAYIQLRDSIECLTLAVEQHPTNDDSIHGYRVINQFDESYVCSEIAEFIKDVGESNFDLSIEIVNIENPRIEAEVHYYQPKHEKLYKMGWKPTKTLTEGLEEMFIDLLPYKRKLLEYKNKIVPQIKWR